MKRNFILLIFLFYFIKIQAQISHEVGLQFTFHNFLDGKGWGYFDDTYIRYPGIYYQFKHKLHSFKVTYEKATLYCDYNRDNTDISSKEIALRHSQNYTLDYYYKLKKWKSFEFNIGSGFIFRRNFDIYYFPLEQPALDKGIFLVPFDKQIQIGNNLRANITYTLLKQLLFSYETGFTRYYSGEFKNTFYNQISIGYRL